VHWGTVFRPVGGEGKKEKEECSFSGISHYLNAVDGKGREDSLRNGIRPEILPLKERNVPGGTVS